MVKFPQKFEDLYPAGTIERVLDVLQQPDIPNKVREALEKVGLKDNNPLDQMQKAWSRAKDWVDSVAFDSASGRSAQSAVINASGQLFHDDYLVWPSDSSSLFAYSRIAESFQLGSALEHRTHQIVSTALGGLHSSFHISVASALEDLARGRRLLVAKCDLLRIPGLGDMSALIDRLDVAEVGAVNGCNQDDWLEAADGDCAILLVSPNSRTRESQVTFREQAIESGRAKSVPVYELTVDATFNDQVASDCNLSNPMRLIEQGVDAVLAPLHLLLGAPVGALVLSKDASTLEAAGRRAKLRGTALQGASRVAAAIAIQGNCDSPQPGSLNAMLLANSENLQNRAERIAGLIQDNGICGKVEVIEESIPQGPSPWDHLTLKNWRIRAEVLHGAPAELAARLAAGVISKESAEKESPDEGEQEEAALTAPPSTRILAVSKPDALEVDLRYVDPRDDHRVAMALSASEFDLEH